MRAMGCPECQEPASFNIAIEGTQESVAYVKGRDGNPEVEVAGSVTVHHWDEDELHCRNCGAVVAEADLVVAQ